MRTGRKSRIFKPAIYFIVSACVGALMWFVGEIIFEGLTEKIFTPLGILLYFLIFFVILGVALTVLLTKKLSGNDFRRVVKGTLSLLLILLLVFLLLTGLFEFLYELGDEPIPEPTSLIFLIDDSGSMSGNEPDRVKAVNDVMKNSKLPFAVYSFTSNAQQMKNMDVYSSELTEEDLAFASYGDTGIISSISDVLNDLEAGKITNAGESPKILLVSDGVSSSFGIRSMARKCRDHSVSISSIGMIGSSERLLKNIAELTGGVFVRCTDVSTLGDDLTKAVASDSDRNLLSERVVYKNNGLYAFLRILFLSLLGLIWSGLKLMMISEEKKFRRKSYILYAVLCIVSTLILEFGTASGAGAMLFRLIFDVCWAITLGTFPKKSESKMINTGGTAIPVSDPFGAGAVDMIDIGKKKYEGLNQLDIKHTSENDTGSRNNSDGNTIFGKNNQNSGNDIFGGNTTNGGNSIFGGNNRDVKNSQNGGSGIFGGNNQSSGNGPFGG